MGDTAAFKVAAGVDFSGGSFAYGPDRKAFDVGEQLDEEPKGVIVTDDPLLIKALQDYSPLEECEVPPDAPVAKVETVQPAPGTPPIQDVVTDVRAEHGDETDE